MTTQEDGAMTPDEYRALRKSLNWSQATLAWYLRVSPSTVSLRERGEVPIDAEAARAILHLIDEMQTAP